MNDPVATKRRSKFGEAIDRCLDKRGVSQTKLAEMIDRPIAYLNHLMVGRRTASASLVNEIVDALKLSDRERSDLHAAAAMDQGFEIE